MPSEDATRLQSSDQFDLAISFAGEDRSLARDIATRMLAAGYKIFYNEFAKSQLWGADLTVELGEIYSERARFCLILISANYATKSWTNHERQFALSRALQTRGPYILPLMVDGTKLSGFPLTIGYLDIRNSSVEEVCRLLSAKLGPPHTKMEDQSLLTALAVQTARDVLSACYRRAVFTRFHAQLAPDAMFSSLAQCRQTLQRLVAYVEPFENQALVAGTISELDLIERVGAEPFTWNHSGTAATIDGAKLRIISALATLAKRSNISFAMPPSLTEELFQNDSEASSAPVGHTSDDRWIGACGGFKG